MMRINKAHVDAKAANVNALLGHTGSPSCVPHMIGAVRLYNVSGSTYMIVRSSSEHGGISQLSESGTLREAAKFLDGMLAALSIQKN